ncbi:protein YohP, partial [Escherichia coli]|uniref:small membrane protein YohP n=1 Tax=Escherichia coli TaxID=562 RepID=UPI00234C4525
DRNRSHWSTSKTPSYTKSVSWQHHPAKGFVFSYTYSALTNKGTPMKIILWAVLIIFLIGLLVVTGVFKMIF